MDSQLTRFLERNGLSRTLLERKIYRMVLLSVLERVIGYLDDGDNRTAFFREVRRFAVPESELAVYRRLIREVSRLELDDEDVQWIKSVLEAYARRSSLRQRASEEMRESLVVRQNGRCAMCHTPISSSDCHVDHVIPFRWVGDELGENLQALCGSCNLSKSDSLFSFYREILDCETR